MHNVILRQNRISQINLKVHYVFIVEVETAYYVYNYESAYWIKGDIKQKNVAWIDWLLIHKLVEE